MRVCVCFYKRGYALLGLRILPLQQQRESCDGGLTNGAGGNCYYDRFWDKMQPRERKKER